MKTYPLSYIFRGEDWTNDGYCCVPINVTTQQIEKYRKDCQNKITQHFNELMIKHPHLKDQNCRIIEYYADHREVFKWVDFENCK